MRDCWEQRGCRYWQQRGKKTDRSEYDGYSSHEEQPLSSRRAATLLTKSSHSPHEEQPLSYSLSSRATFSGAKDLALYARQECRVPQRKNAMPNPARIHHYFLSSRAPFLWREGPCGCFSRVSTFFVGENCFSQSSLKSFHPGLIDRINASFFLRLQPLICFSRAIAF